jgi:hypothetical protein
MASDRPMETELLPSSVTAKIDKKKKTVNYYYISAKGKKTPIKLDASTSRDKPRAPIITETTPPTP